MSRSNKTRMGTGGYVVKSPRSSDKDFKQEANRKARAKTRQALHTGNEIAMPDKLREVSDIWDSNRCD